MDPCGQILSKVQHDATVQIFKPAADCRTLYQQHRHAICRYQGGHLLCDESCSNCETEYSTIIRVALVCTAFYIGGGGHGHDVHNAIFQAQGDASIHPWDTIIVCACLRMPVNDHG